MPIGHISTSDAKNDLKAKLEERLLSRRASATSNTSNFSKEDAKARLLEKLQEKKRASLEASAQNEGNRAVSSNQQPQRGVAPIKVEEPSIFADKNPPVDDKTAMYSKVVSPDSKSSASKQKLLESMAARKKNISPPRKEDSINGADNSESAKKLDKESINKEIATNARSMKDIFEKVSKMQNDCKAIRTEIDSLTLAHKDNLLIKNLVSSFLEGDDRKLKRTENIMIINTPTDLDTKNVKKVLA